MKEFSKIICLDILQKLFSNVYIVSNNNSLDLFKQVLKLLDLKNEDVSDWIENSLYNNTSGSFYSKNFLEGWRESTNGCYYWNSDEDFFEKREKKKFR